MEYDKLEKNKKHAMTTLKGTKSFPGNAFNQLLTSVSKLWYSPIWPVPLAYLVNPPVKAARLCFDQSHLF